MDTTLTREPAAPAATPAGDLDAPAREVAFPPLAPAPAPTDASRRMHELFLRLNRWSVVPIMKAGLGPWFGTPIGGYVLLIRVRGRRSGRIIDVPLSYLITEGAPWVCAGFGTATQWYRNVQVAPEVEVILPGRTFAAVAEEVLDPEVRRRIVPALVRAVGLPGALGGVDPYHDTDDEILEAYGWVPLVRLRPVGDPIVAGPDDPGGTAWIWRQAVVTVLLVVAAGSLRSLVGRVARLVRR